MTLSYRLFSKFLNNEITSNESQSLIRFYRSNDFYFIESSSKSTAY